MISLDSYTGTDDQRMTAALAAVASAGGGQIRIPWRVVSLTSRLVCPDVPIAFVGEDREGSILRWTCADGGILHQPTTQFGHSLTIRDLTLETTLDRGGYAVQHVCPETEGQPSRTLDIESVNVRGVDNNACWTIGLYLFGARAWRIRNVYIFGRPVDHQRMARGIYVKSDKSSCNGVLRDSSVYHANRGLEIVEGTSTGPEGIVVDGCHFVAVDYGVLCQTGEPFLCITNSHVSAWERGVQLKVVDALVSGCHLACKREDAEGDCGDPVYLLDGCQRVRVIGNTLTAVRGKSTGVVCGGNCCVITGNSVDGASTGVWLKSTSSWCRVDNNTFQDVNSGTLDQGVANVTT